MKCFGGRNPLLFSKAAAWVFGVLFLAQCGLSFYFAHPFMVSGALRGPETVIGETDGPTSILVSGGFNRGFSLSDGIILSFALFAASFVWAVLLKRKQKR
jgi:hypothetical protein